MYKKEGGKVDPQPGKDGKPNEPTKVDVVVHAHGASSWGTSKFFGGGSNTPGGAATAKLVIQLINAAYEAGKPKPKGRPTTPGDGVPGKTDPDDPENPKNPPTLNSIEAWQCYGGIRKFQDKDFRDGNLAAVLADYYNKKVKAHCQMVPIKIHGVILVPSKKKDKKGEPIMEPASTEPVDVAPRK